MMKGAKGRANYRDDKMIKEVRVRVKVCVKDREEEDEQEWAKHGVRTLL